MPITNKDILHLADLARLELTAEEVVKLEEEIPEILQYVSKLQKVPTENVPPMTNAAGEGTLLRADAAVACDPAEAQAVVAAFPDRVGQLLRVKSVFVNREKAEKE